MCICLCELINYWYISHLMHGTKVTSHWSIDQWQTTAVYIYQPLSTQGEWASEFVCIYPIPTPYHSLHLKSYHHFMPLYVLNVCLCPITYLSTIVSPVQPPSSHYLSPLSEPLSTLWVYINHPYVSSTQTPSSSTPSPLLPPHQIPCVHSPLT